MINVDLGKAQVIHLKVLERMLAGEIDLVHYEMLMVAKREELDRLLTVMGVSDMFDPAAAEVNGGKPAN